jgi:flagellar hook-length control protein FliK
MDTPAAPPENSLPSGDTPSAGTPIADAPPPPVPATPVTGTIASADPAKPATPEMAQAVVASAIVRPGRDHRGLRAALAAPAGDAPATEQAVAPTAHRTDHAAITAAPLATPASAATPQPQVVTVQGEIGPSVQQQPAVHEDAVRPAVTAMGTTPSLAVIVDKDAAGPSDHAVADGGIAHGGAMPSDLSAARPTSFGDVVAARAPSATLSAQAGTMGRDMGVEIARHVVAGRSEMLVRLDPPDMGRIDVRLSFDREGGLRAVMSADSHGALDLLRRETGDLSRALGDAGIKTDAQSFRFDSRGSDTGQGGQRGQHHQPGQAARDTAKADDGVPLDQPQYRTMRASGHIDVMA